MTRAQLRSDDLFPKQSALTLADISGEERSFTVRAKGTKHEEMKNTKTYEGI